jgi:hypothetical protein
MTVGPATPPCDVNRSTAPPEARLAASAGSRGNGGREALRKPHERCAPSRAGSIRVGGELDAQAEARDWKNHTVEVGDLQLLEESLTYPRCAAGARRCPPEGLRRCSRLRGVPADHFRSPPPRARVDARVGWRCLRPRCVRSQGGRVREPAEAVEEGVRAINPQDALPCPTCLHDTGRISAR